jgi:hypothetical protein
LPALLVVTAATLVAAPPAAADDPTTTTVACAPASVTSGTSTVCTATVSDTVIVLSPLGSVTFSATGPGTFSNGGTCDLVATTAPASSCRVRFTPSAEGDYTVTANYGGSAAATQASHGSTSLTAIDPTATTITCPVQVISVNQETDCTATLSDSFSAVPPTGQVTFSSDPTSGAFNPPAVVCKWTPSGSSGSATCDVTFTPTAPATYTLSASYGGDTHHAPSSGSLTLLVTTTPAGGGPGSKPGLGTVTIPPVGTLSIGATGTVSSHGVATLNLRCLGAGATCSGTVRLTAKEKLKLKVKVKGRSKRKHHGRRHKTKTITRTVTIGSATYRVTGGSSTRLSVKLSHTGFKLFNKARHHRLTVTALATGAVSQTVTLTPAKSKKPKHHKKHKHKKKRKKHKHKKKRKK